MKTSDKKLLRKSSPAGKTKQVHQKKAGERKRPVETSEPKNHQSTEKHKRLKTDSKHPSVKANVTIKSPKSKVDTETPKDQLVQNDKSTEVKASVVEKDKKKKKTLSIDQNWRKIQSIIPENLRGKKKPTTKHAEQPSVPKLISTGSAEKPDGHRKIYGLDCEMVGGEHGQSMLARVCVIDDKCEVVYDKYVRPQGKVVDYRTRYSGISPHHIRASVAIPFEQAQAEVAEIIRGNVVVAHSAKHDFEALNLQHPPHLIRDTAKYPLFRTSEGRPRKLRTLALEHLQIVIQEGRAGHDPFDDAGAAMKLYLKYRDAWEAQIRRKREAVSKV